MIRHHTVRRRRTAAVSAAGALLLLLAACGTTAPDEPTADRTRAAADRPGQAKSSPTPGSSPDERPEERSPERTPPRPSSVAPTADGTPADDRALLRAAERGDTAGVRRAVAAGADLETRDSRKRTPLLLAVTHDRVEAARVLVASGADVDARDDRRDTPWLVTGVTGSVEMARVLIPADPDYTLLNRYGGTSLIPAGEHGHVAYVREVLTRTDLDIDHVNNLGWTALLEAVILGTGGPDHQQVVKLLLDADADPDLADANGTTPLQHADQRGFDKIAALLRAAGADG